ncbi:hypothetical protein [Massilia sp. TS11]|uniref:hypothetical protein n=1 Tax=Massilia sp. TS11 TaxID=2908003 RepID=UPI001EDC4122|nr:hypothetical protein [Massilia sp. TS11]MCG2582742.1 hypothetical protein [Massilia sp. TS11]
MVKWYGLAALSLVGGAAAAEARLTAQEVRWLQAAGPLLAHARQQAVPVDIVVQPQAGPNDVPFAMGYDGKRCKLVLSMRGGGDADAVLAGSAPALQPLLMEAVAAHEFAHCWRNVQGQWLRLPAGFTEGGDEAGSPELLRAAKQQREQRREEGYADLAALAWTAQAHPGEYARVYAWLSALRQTEPAARSAHDTRPWLRLARDGTVFASSVTPFANVENLWQRGLLSGD